jgi:hypothetical protein
MAAAMAHTRLSCRLLLLLPVARTPTEAAFLARRRPSHSQLRRGWVAVKTIASVSRLLVARPLSAVAWYLYLRRNGAGAALSVPGVWARVRVCSLVRCGTHVRARLPAVRC